LAEAPLDGVVPTPEKLFAGNTPADPEERLLKACSALQELIWGNQTQFRLMLARLLEQAAKAEDGHGPPLRQNRRTVLIEAALAPARAQFDDAIYRKLCAALALVLGTESMVVLRDILQMENAEAREVESWAARVLLRAARSGQ